ncbi:MAG: hypothetical protein II937_14110 [Bacteroidales bacterium]|nr:hypothetical protein [Bacteroidales bacterium]
MKNKFITTLLLVVLLAGKNYAQSEEEETQIYGHSRGLSQTVASVDKVRSVSDSGETKTVFDSKAFSVQNQKVAVKNEHQERLEFVSFEAPAGITAIPEKRILASGEEINIRLSFFPGLSSIADSGKNVTAKAVILDANNQVVDSLDIKIELTIE